MKLEEVREGIKELFPRRKKIDYDVLVKAVVTLQEQKKEEDPGMIEELIEEILARLLTDDVYHLVIELKRGNLELEGGILLYDLETYKSYVYDLKDPGMIKELIQEILGELSTDDHVYRPAINLKKKNLNGVVFLYELETYKSRLYGLKTSKCELAYSETCNGNLNSVECGDVGIFHV